MWFHAAIPMRRLLLSQRVRRNGRQNRRALTLLEIILVLTLMCVLGSMAYITVMRPMASQRLDTAADQIRAEWLRARNRAMSRGMTYAFRCSQESGVYTVEPYGDASDNAGWTGSFGGTNSPGNAISAAIQGQLPDQITVHDGTILADELASADFAESGLAADGFGTQGSWTILFFPDGTATSAVITLRNEYGRAVDVSLRGLTGAVLVGAAYPTGTVTAGTAASDGSSAAGGVP